MHHIQSAQSNRQIINASIYTQLIFTALARFAVYRQRFT